MVDEDVARLTAYVLTRVNVRYSFRLPDLGGTWRPRRVPDHTDPDEDD
ncbi:hypothetical protein [Nocardia sp. NPDC057440]